MHCDLEHFLSHLFSFTYDLSYHFTLPHVYLMAHFLFHTYFSKTYITLYYLLFQQEIVFTYHLLPDLRVPLLSPSLLSLAKVLQVIANFFEILYLGICTGNLQVLSSVPIPIPMPYPYPQPTGS